MPIKKISRVRQQVLKVLLWDVEIGTLYWDSVRDISYFFFSPEYFSSSFNISPILFHKNSAEAHHAIFGSRENKLYQKLPPFIADSLPDKWGNAIFDEWFQKNNLPTSEKTPLTKLSFIGKTAMGALEFLPASMQDSGSSEINLYDLVKEAKTLEDKLNGLKVENNQNVSVDRLRMLGTSPGGSRSKAIISQLPDGTFVSGKTSTDKNNKHFIIKFNSPQYSLSEIEMTYHELAVLAGIQTMPSRLIDVNGIKHFLTERFDRRNGEKVFMQTFAALNDGDETYEELFRTCRLLDLPEPEIQEMYRRMVFNFMMNNTDDHKKNFSFLMAKDGKWTIAPHYDITFILETGNTPCDTHCMSINGKYSNVAIDDLLGFAHKNSIKNAQQIIMDVANASQHFQEIASKYSVRPDIKEIIENRLEQLRPEEYKCHTEFSEKPTSQEKQIWFERSEKGNIHLLTTLTGVTRKYVITPKRSEYTDILNAGFNEMPYRDKLKYAQKFILKNGIILSNGNAEKNILRQGSASSGSPRKTKSSLRKGR